MGDHLFRPPAPAAGPDAPETPTATAKRRAAPDPPTGGAVDYSVRVPPALTVTFASTKKSVVIERYGGETAARAVARVCVAVWRSSTDSAQ